MTINDILNDMLNESKKRKHKTGKVTERAMHQREDRKRGKASKHKCKHCGKQAEIWAKVGNHSSTYTTTNHKIKFIPLCKSCHAKYDKNADRINKK